eukprot:2088263-Alexandrium_andersonii.AAC.1
MEASQSCWHFQQRVTLRPGQLPPYLIIKHYLQAFRGPRGEEAPPFGGAQAFANAIRFPAHEVHRRPNTPYQKSHRACRATLFPDPPH